MARRGDRVSIQYGNVRVQAEFLGKGHYTTAWRLPTGEVRMHTVPGEYMKELVAGIRDNLPHVPQVEANGWTTDGRFLVYTMPYYPNLNRQEHPQAWADYRLLQKLHGQAVAEVQARVGYVRFSYATHHCEINYVFIGLVTSQMDRDGWPEAIEALCDAASNYGAGVGFEWGKRNLGVDTEGRLVLRDVLYDAEKIARYWEARRQRHDAEMNRRLVGR